MKVNHSGAQVRARQGYYTRPANQPVATDEAEILAAVNSPLEFTALPLTVRWSESKAGKTPGKRLALFELILPANAIVIDEADRNHMSLSFAAIARTPTGDSAGNVDQNVQAQLKPDTLAQVRGSGITYRNGLELPPGEYAVHFAVRDNLGGKVGTVTAPLRIDSLPH